MVTDALNPRLGILLGFRQPDLRFSLPLVADLTISCGLKQATEACCRYAHHPTCPSAVVTSVVGVRAWLRCADDAEAVEYQLAPYQSSGDLLADFGQLMAVVRTQCATLASTAEIMRDQQRQSISLGPIEVSVWCLVRAEAADLARQWTTLTEDDEEVDALPLAYLDPDDEEASAQVTSGADFLAVELYAGGELVLPGEIGRDHEHRYLSQGVIDAPDPVDRLTIKEALVHVVLVDGTETDLAVRARYTGTQEEPLDMSFATVSPREASS